MRYLKQPIETPEEVTREVRETVSEIISDVERHGTDAVRRHSRRLDGWDPPTFRVTDEEIERAYDLMGRMHANLAAATRRARQKEKSEQIRRA